MLKKSPHSLRFSSRDISFSEFLTDFRAWTLTRIETGGAMGRMENKKIKAI
jgi:hypothetical protein